MKFIHILFMHAILGCDTTSRLFGIGKGVVLTKANYPLFTDQANIFLNNSSSLEQIGKAGERVLMFIYGSNTSESLDNLRYRQFLKRLLLLQR